MPFDLILEEVTNLHGVGARLEGYADEHPHISVELMGVASSVRNAATFLGVLLVTKTDEDEHTPIQ